MTQPRFVFIRSSSSDAAFSLCVKYCRSFLCRLRGYTFHPPIGPNEGLLMDFGRNSRLDTAIHMLGVSFDLAVFWINQAQQVVDKTLARAWRPAYLPKAPARYVLETHPDRLNDLHIGQHVYFDDVR